MNIKKIFVATMMLLLVSTTAVSVFIPCDADPPVEDTISSENIGQLTSTILNISLTEGCNVKLIDNLSDFPNSVNDDLYLINPSLVVKNDTTVIKNQIESTILNGNSIMMIGSSELLTQLKDVPISIDFNAPIVCIKYHSDNGYSSVMSLDVEDKSLIENHIKNWMSVNDNPSNILMSSDISFGTSWHTASILETIKQDSWGTTYVRAIYGYAPEQQLQWNYVCGKLIIEVEPADSISTPYFTNKVFVQMEPYNYTDQARDRYLFDHGPSSKSDSTAYVNLSTSDVPSISWQYPLSAIGLDDSGTSYMYDILDQEYDYDYLFSSAREKSILKPGILVGIDCVDGHFKTGSYTGTDTVNVEYKKMVSGGILPSWGYKTHTLNIHTSIKANPYTISIDGNGHDGNYIYEESGDETYNVDVYETQWSHGGTYTLLNDMFYKDGYTYIGLSTNPNATTPEYVDFDDIVVTGDLYLYCIYEENS